MKVSDVMTRRVISVTPEATVRHAIHLMLRGPEFVVVSRPLRMPI